MKRIRHALCLEIGQTDDRVDVLFDDLFRIFCCYVLDGHAAGLRTHHDDAFRLTIHDKGEIVLFLDMAAGFNQKTIHLLALRAGLAGDEHFAKTLLRIFSDFIQRTGELDTARFPAAACMDLCLYDHDRRVKALRIFQRIFDCECRIAFRNMDAILTHDLLTLVFMDIHTSFSLP